MSTGSRRNIARPFEIPDPAEIDDLDRAAERRVKLDVRTHIPATVITFDATAQTARVRVDAIPVLVDALTGKDAPQAPLEVIVPVVFPGDESAYLTWPVSPGTTGTLHVHDRSIARWLARVGSVAVDPVEFATHQIHDAEFVPGLTDNAHRIPVPVDSTAIVLEHATGIKLGRAAVLGVARRTDAVAPDAAMIAWALVIETFINGLVPGTFTPANSFAGTVQAAFASISTASTKVSAE